jgi:hypothetical protein
MMTQPWWGKESNAVIEVNFYVNREFDEHTRTIGVHKNTDSRNLFVNLIFNNQKPMPGTEWALDKVDPSAERNVELKSALPKSEYDAIPASKKEMKPGDQGMDRWEGGLVPKQGFVSWVDELIWHSTLKLSLRCFSHFLVGFS